MCGKLLHAVNLAQFALLQTYYLLIAEISQQLVVITGTNRDPSLETCHQLVQWGLKVMVTSRDSANDYFRTQEVSLISRSLDVADPTNIDVLYSRR